MPEANMQTSATNTKVPRGVSMSAWKVVALIIPHIVRLPVAPISGSFYGLQLLHTVGGKYY